MRAWFVEEWRAVPVRQFLSSFIVAAAVAALWSMQHRAVRAADTRIWTVLQFLEFQSRSAPRSVSALRVLAFEDPMGPVPILEIASSDASQGEPFAFVVLDRLTADGRIFSTPETGPLPLACGVAERFLASRRTTPPVAHDLRRRCVGDPPP